MLKLRKVFDQSFLSSIYRNYVSIININADTVKKIKILPDEYENSYQDSEIRVEAIDGEKNLIKLNDSNSKITKTKDEFNFEWLDKKDDTEIIFELPLSSCREMELKINCSKGQIKVDNIPGCKSIDLKSKFGRVLMKYVRTERVEVEAPEVAIESVYSMTMDVKGTNQGTVLMRDCQVELLRVAGSKVSLDSCYTHNVEINAENQCLLKNLHGNARVKAEGEVFNIVGFSGTIKANSTCRDSVLHFAQLVDENKITIDHPMAFVRAGFANEIVKETTDLHIKSSCFIQTKSKEFVVCHRAKDEYEVIRKNPESDSLLQMDIKNAKEVHIIKQSWIDSLKFDY